MKSSINYWVFVEYLATDEVIHDEAPQPSSSDDTHDDTETLHADHAGQHKDNQTTQDFYITQPCHWGR